MTVPQLRPLYQEGSRVPASGKGGVAWGIRMGERVQWPRPKGRGAKPRIGHTVELRPTESRA